MPLAVCATPIGNLEDVTLRVLAELRDADVVLCEDTRHTRTLLQRHSIDARVLSIFMLVFQGGLAAGSGLSGIVAARAGIQHALLWAGLGIVATTALGLVSPLPDATTDVSPCRLPPARRQGLERSRRCAMADGRLRVAAATARDVALTRRGRPRP